MELVNRVSAFQNCHNFSEVIAGRWSKQVKVVRQYKREVKIIDGVSIMASW